MQPETWIEVDVDAAYELTNAGLKTKVGWTPFAGSASTGAWSASCCAGNGVRMGFEVLASPGSGRVVSETGRISD
jgi:dihydroorotase-like cyclic amidohydrolase